MESRKGKNFQQRLHPLPYYLKVLSIQFFLLHENQRHIPGGKRSKTTQLLTGTDGFHIASSIEKEQWTAYQAVKQRP